MLRPQPPSAWDAIALRRSMGYVIQEAGLFPHFNVERNVALVPARIVGRAETARRSGARSRRRSTPLAYG
ncbi:MAG TPA: hypothetical protein VGB76_07055 [Pyrinomonadaceae bacterium]